MSEWECPICLRVVEGESVSGCANGHSAAVLRPKTITESPRTDAMMAAVKGMSAELKLRNISCLCGDIERELGLVRNEITQWREVAHRLSCACRWAGNIIPPHFGNPDHCAWDVDEALAAYDAFSKSHEPR